MLFDEVGPLTTRRGDTPKRIRNGSPQQEAFWQELIDGSGPILLEARAGTGKSSSCREGMHRIIETSDHLPVIRYCCFNKAIVKEFEDGCPTGVEVGTMHRFGLQALAQVFGSKFDNLKTYSILDALGGSDLKRYIRKSISTLVGLAKNHGLSPDDPGLRTQLDDFVYYYDVETWHRQHEILDWAEKALKASAESTAVVDFDDMLWLSVLHDVRFPSVDFLFLDEAQDLNPVQHLLAVKMAGSGRTIVVGDPYQSIYAFRGADSQSIPKLRDRLGAKVMPLTVTWRCPRSHVEMARELVADFEAAPEAPEGILDQGDKTLIDSASSGDMVLCRTNAPIVSACLRAIANRRRAYVRGRAIGDSLLAVVRKLGDPATIPAMIRAVAVWRAREIANLEAKDGTEVLIEGVMDRAACLEAIAGSCSSPAEVPGVIGQLFSDENPADRITFSSVHRAKGSEARNVTYIQIPFGEKRDRFSPPQQWELDQRRNLRYVALTRSMDRLTLVS